VELGAVTETELLRAVRQLSARYDVVCDHRNQPLHDLPGWPDCSLLGTAAAAFRELKGPRGVVSPAQQSTGQRMLQAGLYLSVWWPRDYESGRVEREIAALSGKTPWPQR
jgi:hypothetical protein